MDSAFAAAMGRILAAAGGAETVIAALSGGMDSVAMLHLLARWRAGRPDGPRLLAAHLNHGLRGENAALDQEFSRNRAKSLGIDFVTRSVDTAETAREERLGIEEAGRLLRYRFFHDLGGGGGLVLTGHHADDQAETILLHLRRGSHRRGLAGMREFTLLPVPPGLTLRLGRPLLGVPRERLHAYALEQGLDWREDESNQDSGFARNRIRHRVIPMLESLLPGFRDRLLAKAERMAREEDALNREGARLADSLSRREAGGRFLRLVPETFAEPERLLYAFRHLVEDEMGERLPYGAILSRLALLAESGRLGETLTLPGNLHVRRERDGLFFFFAGGVSDAEPAEIVLPDPPFEIRAAGLALTAAWLPSPGLPPPEDRADPTVEWLNPAGIRWPLALRPPRPGERFRPLGAPGSRKIQDILVDCKAPRRLRGLPRVVADHAGAVWLWPYRLANRVRLGEPLAKALRMHIREEN